MAESKRGSDNRNSLTVLKNETKLVMEAFLQRIQNEGSTVGHVGRYYHDPRKFKAKTPDGQETITTKLPKHRKSLHKDTLEREDEEKRRTLKPPQGPEEDTGWDSMHEEISRVEEKKHGFKTAIKKLIKKQKKKGSDASDKKPKDSPDFPEMYGSVKNAAKAESKGHSLRRRKSSKHVSAYAMESSSKVEIATEESSKERKSGRQKFLDIFRKISKKNDNEGPEEEQMPPPISPRPTTLALSSSTTEQEFYSKVAKQLDRLAQGYCAQPANDPRSEVKSPEQVNNNVPLTNKERAIERIVLMLQDQGDKINEKMKDDPLLQHSMSYHSFSQLVEAFTANIEGRMKDPVTSPELTKIALTMELTRRVVGISSHPVQQLMGYSMQYIDMFVPWLQDQGGWESVLTDQQID